MYCWENLTVFLLKFYFQMIFYEILLSNRKKKVSNPHVALNTNLITSGKWLSK